MLDGLTLVEVLAFPAIIAGIGLTFNVADHRGATFKETALLAVGCLILAAGFSGVYAIHADQRADIHTDSAAPPSK